MFDISFFELLLMAVVALLVLGPERLAKAARFAGLWVRRARAQWYSVKSELENELAAEELKRSLHETQDTLRQTRQDVESSLREARDQLQQGGEALEREMRDAQAQLRDAVRPQPEPSPAAVDATPEPQALPAPSAATPSTDAAPGEPRP